MVSDSGIPCSKIKKAIIDTILMLAGYTYGPLLGLFALGLFTKVNLNDKLVPIICLVAPVVLICSLIILSLFWENIR
ncbi:MAG: hypothetical protein IPJ32_21055 [Sphingobacteriaceae bacterium]|nr:hypothetical protein [Sphingobacteriaceae bacterium]